MSRFKKPRVDQDGEESVNSETVHLPLPDELDFTGLESVNEPGLWSDGGYSPSVTHEQCDHPEKHPVHPPVRELDRKSAANLKSMIEDSCLSTPPSFKFVMPWDRPGISNILNRKRSFSLPKPVLQLIEPVVSPATSSPSVPLPSDKVTRGYYGEVINFKMDLSENELEEKQLRQALEKWYVVFATGEDAWPRGFDLRNAVRLHRLEDMKLVFGNRSANTILRRGSSMLQFVNWYKSKFFQLCPFPVTPEAVEEYVLFMVQTNRPASAFHGFVESLVFCQHVLGMNVACDGNQIISVKVQRMLDVEDSKRREKTQSRVLTVAEVEILERCLNDEKLDLVDRVACGTLLFCFYSRSRWSDLRRVYGFIEDISEREGRIAGYLECRTRSHKTARLVSRSGMAMPLIAPVWGVTSPPWGMSFSRLFALSGRPTESIDHQPMLLAPKPDGTWSNRSVTTTEAGKWLRKLLSNQAKSDLHSSAHSLKSTPLSWCAKWGLDPDVRLILGHHKTGKSSAECYGRDNLAKPLRDFDLVLQQIRTKAFVPDATRSGMVGTPGADDPKDTYRAKLQDADADSESSSSDDTSDASGSSDASVEPEVHDEVSAPRRWDPDIDMYRNKKRQIVHVVASGGAENFSCGVKISEDFEMISETQFLDIRKCKRCALAKPLKTAGQVAAALEKLRKR